MQHTAVRRKLDIRGDAAGEGGEVDHQAVRLELRQLGRSKYGCGDGVEDQLEAAELPCQMACVERRHARCIDTGEIARRTRGNRHMRVQCAQFAREQRTDPPAADDKAARTLQGVRGLFHGELYGTLAGREIVYVLRLAHAA